jgi:ABC-type sugar transport system ATPase subunit
MERRPAMARVIFDGVTKRYAGGGMAAVNDLNMEVENEEFLVLVGWSPVSKRSATAGSSSATAW